MGSGTCTVCLKEFTLNADGNIRGHAYARGFWPSVWCTGSRRPPAEAQ